MDLLDITPLILTYNEAPNLRQTLRALDWAKRIVVVDSGSDDDTLSICAEFAQVDVVARPFDDHTSQWNFGLDQIHTHWVLTLDADYLCPSEFRQEVIALDGKLQAYAIRFHYAVYGRVLRGTLYPPRVALFRPTCFRYVQDGHTQLLDIQKKTIGELRNPFIHDDRKPLSRWLRSQQPYAELECRKLCTEAPGRVGWKDRIRSWIVVAPFLTFIYCLICKRLIFDGRAGLFYALQRTYAELLLSLHLASEKLNTGSDKRDPQSHVSNRN